jgi:Lrp/AsnC family leucine-responsive transcriptional regulator
MPKTIDDVDRKILLMLQRDGRMSLTEMARRIGGLTKVAVSYRVRRLRSTGVIQGFHARINPERVGQGFLFATQLVLKNKGPGAILAAKRIAALSGVQSVFLTFGEYDALVLARAQDAGTARDLVYQMYQMGGVVRSATWISHTVVKESVDVRI